MRTSNPAFKASAMRNFEVVDVSKQMTVQGAINKTGILLVLLITSAFFTWNYVATHIGRNIGALLPWLMGAAIGGLVIAFVTAFKPRWAKVTAPLYALLEGLLLGTLSLLFELIYPGIVMQAFLATFGVLFTMLALYSFRIIRVTAKLRAGIMMATGAVMLLYLATWILGMFGVEMAFMHDGGPLSIIITLAIIAVAAFNLLLDFDFIERGADEGAPKYLEWYAGFGLMVTLVWLYLEILRLLSYLQSD